MLAPLVLFLQNLLENIFKVLLQIVKGIWIRLQEAFSRFEIFSPVTNAFPLTLNKTPPEWNSPLSAQEGFINWNKINYLIAIWKMLTNWKILFLNISS
jgi:hypothetical protein